MKFILMTIFMSLIGCSMYVKPAPAHAEIYVEKPAVTTTVYVSAEPPAPRIEYRPAPRVGYIWVDGYWHWSGRSWIWMSGHWEAERVGYVWVAPRYEVKHQKKVYVKGYWAPQKGYRATGSASHGYKASPAKPVKGYKASPPKSEKGYKSSHKHSKKSKRS
jgi:hypothetical protein